MEIKICGITKKEEINFLNDAKVDYAGFVIFEKSKRYITVEKAAELFGFLSPGIKKVAVTVSPTPELAKEIEKAGFDVLQVHKELSAEVIDSVSIPVWYAFNISNSQEIAQKEQFINSLTDMQRKQIEAFVVDGAEYGSGKTFDWNSKIDSEILKQRKFALAGGLNASNVSEGIKTFSPDIVDVSSGVEGTNGKDEALIKEFVERVRTNE